MKKTQQKTNKIVRKHVNILGINVLSTTRAEVLTAVKEFVAYNIKFYITTPNPELVLASTKDSELKKALNGSTLAVPDGVGLNYASRFLFGMPLEIIPGRKLFIELLKLADHKKWKVFFFGGEMGEAKVASIKLKMKYKKLKIETHNGPIVDNSAEPVTEIDIKLQKDAVDKINKFAPQILFVAMKNPKQEIWIYKNLRQLNINGAMTVGGTFRYVAGLSKLPPKWMEEYGLEWVWRLITEPYRFRRIFNAFPVFPIKVLMSKLQKN